MFLGSGLAYAGTYTDSAHGQNINRYDLTGDSRYNPVAGGYATGNCAHCHEAHASLDGDEPAPKTTTPDPGPDKVLLFSEEEYVCEACHDGTGPATDDIKTQIDKTYAHPTDDYSGRHKVSESTTTNMNPSDYAATANRHAECVDCHNPHTAGSTKHAKETNAVTSTSPLYKVCGVEPNYTSAWTAPSTYTEIPTSTGISKEYQLCFKCHSNWTTQPSGQTNIALQFNTYNASYHSVVETGKASAYGTYETPWDQNSLMYCSDCHGSEISSDPAGPHGSTIEHILKGNYNRNTGESGTSSHLCFDCHAYETYRASGTNTGRYTTNFSTYKHDGINLHTYAKHNGAVCMDCHCALPHGINQRHLIVLTSDTSHYNNGAKIGTYTPNDSCDYDKWNCGTVSGCHN